MEHHFGTRSAKRATPLRAKEDTFVARATEWDQSTVSAFRAPP